MTLRYISIQVTNKLPFHHHHPRTIRDMQRQPLQQQFSLPHQPIHYLRICSLPPPQLQRLLCSRRIKWLQQQLLLPTDMLPSALEKQDTCTRRTIKVI